MEERVWDSSKGFGKFMYNLTTFFGLFDEPSDVCKALRNVFLGIPFFLFVSSVVVGGIVYGATITAVTTPYYFISDLNEEYPGRYLGYSLESDCSKKKDEKAVTCTEAQELLKNMNAFERFVIENVIMAFVIYLMMCAAFVLWLLTDKMPKVFDKVGETQIWKDMKEAHEDKICFKIKWK